MTQVFILPTKGPIAYRGKYPTRARSVSFSPGSGWHVELNNGTRLWSLQRIAHNAGDDYAAYAAAADIMTAAQYDILLRAAVIRREAQQFAGRGRRVEVYQRACDLLATVEQRI